MFIVTLTYKKPLEEIDHHLGEHRAAITAYYDFNEDPKKKDFLLAANRPGIQALVTKAYQRADRGDNYGDICEEICRKYNKAIK